MKSIPDGRNETHANDVKAVDGDDRGRGRRLVRMEEEGRGGGDRMQGGDGSEVED